jgi:hypothetical protein
MSTYKLGHREDSALPISIGERYKLIIAEHHYAIDLREKIVRGWGIVYAALAAAFVWVQSGAESASWTVAAAAVVVTLLFWVADLRNRIGIRASKDAGSAIESDPDAGIPKDQRFFERVIPQGRLERILTHSCAIDIFAAVAIVLLIAATWFLYCRNGILL